MWNRKRGENDERKKGQFRQIWKRLIKHKPAVVSLCIIIVFMLVAVFANVIADFETVVIRQNLQNRLEPPNAQNWLGTDGFGRDIFARIIHGARISLSIAIIATITAMGGGIVFGALCGFFGGKVDNVIMRISDAFLCIPSVLLAIAIVAALGNSFTNVIVALTVGQIPQFTRIVRSVVLSLRENDYVEAARACATSDLRIIYRHILPNAMGPIIVQSTMSMASMILDAAALGFLGMGVPPPTPEWGMMLNEGRLHIRSAPHIIITPGIVILMVAVSFNMLGDGLRDALDPRLKN